MHNCCEERQRLDLSMLGADPFLPQAPTVAEVDHILTPRTAEQNREIREILEKERARQAKLQRRIERHQRLVIMEQGL